MANQVKLPHTSSFSLTLKTMIINWEKDCNLSIHAYHVHFLYPIREGHILPKDLKITIDDQQYKCCGQNKQPEPHIVRLLLNINISGTDMWTWPGFNPSQAWPLVRYPRSMMRGIISLSSM